MDTESILVMGTGAMACLYSARLAAAGANICMLGTWADGLQALRRDGVRIVEEDSQEHAFPVRAADDPIECTGARLAMVLVKSWQTERVARQLKQCLAEDGLALTLQNGIGNYETLVAALGTERVAAGVTTLGATLLQPGLVRQAGHGVIVLNGHPHLGPLVAWLRKAGCEVEFTTDLKSLIWGKLVVNAAINPLTALLGVPNGELLNRGPARALLAGAAQEAAAVAVAQGIQLPYPDPVATVEGVAARTAQNRSSMLQDVRRGAPTEIDAICGAIVRAGEQSGVPTPINRALWQLVSALSVNGKLDKG